MSTRLRRQLNLHLHPEDVLPLNDENKSDKSLSVSKTRRWRKPCATPNTTTNQFGPISAQMIYCLFAFISQTKNDSTIWGGSLGERFLAEFLRTIAIMVDCARNYPSSASRVLAMDLFQLAWSFHDAKNSEVRYAVLVAMATSASIVPIEFLLGTGGFDNLSGWMSFLETFSIGDAHSDCRKLASLMVKNM